MAYFYNKQYQHLKHRNPASKSLTENEVIIFLDQYLTNFEQNLRDNNFDQMNTSLIKNLISQFGKIFYLWEQNLIFQRSIGQADVKKIYKSMHHIFGMDHDQHYEPIDAFNKNEFRLECNRCGETFPLRNNNCKYSYEVHSLTKEHLEFIRNLNDSEDDSDTAGDAPDMGMNLKKKNYVPVLQPNLINVNMKSKQSVLEEGVCTKLGKLCIDEEKRKPTAVPNNSFATKIQKQTSIVDDNSISALDPNYFKNNIIVCKICPAKLKSKIDFSNHVASKYHLENMKLFKSGKKYEGFYTHCQSNSHLETLKNSVVGHPFPEKRKSADVPTSSTQKHTSTVKGDAILAPSANDTKIQKQISTVKDDLISVLDKHCIIFKKNIFVCELCPAKLSNKDAIISHIVCKNHLKNIKLYKSCTGDFMNENRYKIQCTLCNFEGKKYEEFSEHCQSTSHLKKLKKLAIEYFSESCRQRFRRRSQHYKR